MSNSISLYTFPIANSVKTQSKSSIIDEVSNTVKDSTDKLKSLFGTIGVFDSKSQKADDLKKISGVGPKLESVLNNIGLFTFEQVSKMTKKEYDLLDSITGSFPGRAERDDWAGQAKNLING